MENIMMMYDPSALTYSADFSIQPTDHVARLSAGITTKDDLCAALQQQLAVPSYFTTGNWDQLFEVLRFPNFELPPGVSRSGRTVLLHQDIPLLRQDWMEAQTYLEILIESIRHLHKINQPKEASVAGKGDILIAVFPPEFADEIQKILSRRYWEASIGMREAENPIDLIYQREPDWQMVHLWLTHLNGLTAEFLQLHAKKQISITVTYLYQQSGYYIKYQALSEERPMALLSSPTEQNVLTHLLQRDEVTQFVRYIYEHYTLPPMHPWYPAPWKDLDLEELAIEWYYNNAEKEWIERPYEMVKYTIYRGVEEQQIFYTFQDWQEILEKSDASQDLRLAAICVLSEENLAATYDQLLTFLVSPQMEERWMSARFLGQAYEERALPVILAMLNENREIQASDEDGWTFFWRFYAPKLLRHWQIESVTHALYESLQTWFESETLFDHEATDWMNFEAHLCYELGYRNAFELVLQLPLQAAHHRFLLVSMAQGYYTKSHAISFHEETQHGLHRHTHTRAVENNMVDILETRCHFSKEKTQELLHAYHEAFDEDEITF
jgi:Barstar (barnase inhibitor)